MPYLVVKWRNEEVHRIELTGPLTIGREIGVEVWINDPALSRKHCRIEQDEVARWIVIDLHSRNGIYVNETRVKRRVLTDCDRFRIGEASVTFHDAAYQSRRAANPEDAMFESRMEPPEKSAAPSAPAVRPTLTATTSRVAERTLRPTPVSFAAKPGEPLVEPFGLAFQRPPAQPMFQGMQAPIQRSGPTSKSRGWIVSCLHLLRSHFNNDRDVA